VCTLTGGSDAEAEAALVELERGNLFVVPLDQERLAWRYHHRRRRHAA
jgi:ATP/maltotriose-dependent transcriptional regulator MalT